MNVELVIFDCDGVLVDSEVISNRVLAERLTASGLPTTLAQARHDYQGLLLADVAAHAQRRLGRALGDGWLQEYERVRAEAFEHELAAVPGAADAVRAIRGAGIGVCVASQGRLDKTRLSLKLTGLDGLFADAALFSAEDVARPKPHPDLFLHAAGALGAAPARCVVVEDTASGVRAGIAAGMHTFGFAADSDAQALRAAGAEILHDMRELPILIEAHGSRSQEMAQ